MKSRARDTWLLVGAVGLSAAGDFLALIPLALELQESTGSGILVSALFIALWSPVVLLAAPAGLAADRLDNRRLLIIGSAIQALVALALAFSTSSTAAILALTALLGAGFAFVQPAEFALAPAVAGSPERLTVVNGYIETARYAGMTVGPLAGGLIAATGGTRTAILIDAGTFIVVALAAALLTVTRRPEPHAEDAVPERARDGMSVLFRDRVLAVVLPAAFASLLFMTASATAEVFFAKDVLDAGDGGYGALMSCWFVGMMIGAAGIARRIGPAALATAALAAMVVQGVGIGLPVVWLTLPFAMGMYLVGGLGHGVKNVLLRSLIQARVPSRLLGRAFAAYNGLRNAAELAALALGGLLVAAIGARATLAIAGGVPALIALAALVRARRMPEATAPAPVVTESA